MRISLLPALMLATLAPAANSESQKHAPSIEMCRADLARWYDVESATEYKKAETLHLTGGVKNLTPAAKLPLKEVNARIIEMGECSHVDTTQSNAYAAANDFYAGVQGDRYFAFIVRHNLMSQIMKEDAQGLR
jgi:hypothetical protein